MDKAKDVAKRGWHPAGKNGGKESWRGDFKGINSVATKLGHGKATSSTDAAKDHVSRPLASLKDPDSFGPPPKNVNYHGGAAVPHQITPDRRGLGSPLSPTQIQGRQEQEQREEAARSKPAPPPVPYRANRTGLNTSNLPKPPVRRANGDNGSPASASPATSSKPNLPPRLPPRQNSHPLDTAPVDPPPPYTAVAQQPQQQAPRTDQSSIVNQGAVNRLGAAGISVPGLGIGRNSSQDSSQQSHEQSTASTSSAPSHFGGLQSRFANLSTQNSQGQNLPTQAPAAGGRTSFAQKQAALRTASNFQKDPSSVSMADARATASTANNFRERHGEQVAQGWKVGAGLNQKYGIADKVGAGVNAAGARSPPPPPSAPQSPPPVNGGEGSSVGINRKPPPPPVPVGSKPR